MKLFKKILLIFLIAFFSLNLLQLLGAFKLLSPLTIVIIALAIALLSGLIINTIYAKGLWQDLNISATEAKKKLINQYQSAGLYIATFIIGVICLLAGLLAEMENEIMKYLFIVVGCLGIISAIISFLRRKYNVQKIKAMDANKIQSQYKIGVWIFIGFLIGAYWGELLNLPFLNGLGLATLFAAIAFFLSYLLI